MASMASTSPVIGGHRPAGTLGALDIQPVKVAHDVFRAEKHCRVLGPANAFGEVGGVVPDDEQRRTRGQSARRPLAALGAVRLPAGAGT